MAIDRSAVDAIQAYYLTHKEGFYTKTFVQPMLENFMMVTAKDKLMLQSADSTSVLQSYQSGHHTKGDVSLGARQLDMRDVKADQTFETREFSTDAYHAYLQRSGNDPRDFPFQAFVIQMIMDQMFEDFTNEVMWNGIYLGPIVGAPNNPADTADGFRKLIRDEIVAGNITVYATGLLTSANALDGLRQFVKDQLESAAKRRRLHYVFCSIETVDAYQENYEDSIGSYRWADDAFQLTRIHGTNTFLVPQDGLSGSPLVMARPDNLHVGMDGPPALVLDYSSRELKVEIDWKYGFQFASVTELYANEWV